MNQPNKPLPRFFIIDGLPVRLVLEGDEVAGYTFNGTPYSLGKALEGIEVNKDDYNTAVSKLLNQDEVRK